MNYFFSTGAERIAVIEQVRCRVLVFGSAPMRPISHHYSPVITWLLKHNPDERPTALELSQSNLLPPRLEDEYFKGALKMMSKLPSKVPSRYSYVTQPKPILLTVRRFSHRSSTRLPEVCEGFSMIAMSNIQNTHR